MTQLFTIIITGISVLSLSAVQVIKSDLEAYKVIEKRTDFNGIHYSYQIRNNGSTVIPAGSYKVYFRVDGRLVSFNKNTSEIKPGQVISYESSQVFYQKKRADLRYSLEIKFVDAQPWNNVLSGRSVY